MDEIQLEHRLTKVEQNCQRIPVIENKIDKISSRLYIISGGMGLAAYVLSLAVNRFINLLK